MNKLLIVILVLSLIVNLIGLYFAWEYRKARGQVVNLQYGLDDARQSIATMTDALDRSFRYHMVFLHHSVGKGLLTEGGLSDSLQQMGVLVRGATYGDEIGQETDMADWPPKFMNDLSRILAFKGHPNLYYQDGRTNDVVMFKSCYPNSYVESDGSGAGDPSSRERTLANYKAIMTTVGKEMRKHPDKLFVYLTYPPLVPSATTPEIAARARQFNNWLIKEYQPSYVKENGLDNFVIFDLFDCLADQNNVLKPEYRVTNAGDSHPNDLGSREATRQFMQFFRPVWDAWLAHKPAAVAQAGR